GGADEDIVPVTAGADHHVEQLIAGEAGPVAELDLVDTVQKLVVAKKDRIAIGAEAQQELVAARCGRTNDQLVGTVTGDFEGVGAARILDDVAPVAALVFVSVVTRPAAQLIVAQAAAKTVGTRAAEDDVIAVAGLVRDRPLDERHRIPRDRKSTR